MKQRRPLQIDIAGTSSISPGKKVTTESLVLEGFGDADSVRQSQLVESITRKTGIHTRYFADEEDGSETLGAEVLRAALDDAGIEAEELERIIFVSSIGGELIVPATANLICRALGLRDSCDCFDLTNSCTGFLTALDIASCSIAAGSGPVGIVVMELTSRGLRPTELRPFLVFGDAVTATVLRESTTGGILANYLRNDSMTFGNVRMKNSHHTRRHELFEFTDANAMIVEDALAALKKCIAVVLQRTQLSIEDIDWILPHQPNGAIFDSIVDTFSLPEEKIIPVAHEIGSTAAASIPFSLDRLKRTGKVKAGDKMLFAAVGGGVSYGATVYEVPDQ